MTEHNETRARFVCDRLYTRLAAVLEAVPPFEPEAQWWLMSDAGPSYCYDCVVKARAEEFGLGIAPIRERLFSRGTELEEAFWDGIDSVGTYNCTESSTYCETCGEILAYFWVNDQSLEEEMAAWREYPMAEFTPHQAYQLHQLLINVCWSSSRFQIVHAAKAVKQAELALKGTP